MALRFAANVRVLTWVALRFTYKKIALQTRPTNSRLPSADLISTKLVHRSRINHLKTHLKLNTSHPSPPPLPRTSSLFNVPQTSVATATPLAGCGMAIRSTTRRIIEHQPCAPTGSATRNHCAYCASRSNWPSSLARRSSSIVGAGKIDTRLQTGYLNPGINEALHHKAPTFGSWTLGRIT